MKAKKILFIVAFTVALLSVPALSMSQEDNSDGPEGSGEPPPTDAPFDGGVVVLTIIGVSYGILKMRKANIDNLDTVNVA